MLQSNKKKKKKRKEFYLGKDHEFQLPLKKFK